MLTAESFEARKKDFLAYKDTLVKEPTGESVKKEYRIGCYNASDWKFVHEELKKDGSLEDNIPSASCDVINDCIHSSTRGIYLLTDVEAASLRNHPKVVYVDINIDAYPGTYLLNPDDIAEHNGGKDIKIGDDKRPVSIIPKEQQVLHDFASGEVLVDEFGVPLLAEQDAIFAPDATADRSTSIVFSDLDTTSDRNIFETISLTQAVYGDYDIPIGTSIKNLDVGNPTNTGIATVKTQGGVGIATVGIGSMKILKADGTTTITHDQWPYLDIRSVEEQGITDSSGNEIPRNTNKIYLPDYVGITSILKVDNSDSDPITNKKFLVTGKYLEGNVRIVNVAYNSRLTLAKSHTANDEILGLTSTIPISIGANKVVTVTLSNHGFVTGDLVHIKTQKESGGIIVLNRNYTKSYKVTKVSDSVFTFVHDYSASLNNTTGRVFIKTSVDNKFVSDSFKLETTNESSGGASPEKIKRYLNSVRHKRDIEGGASGSSDYIPSNPNQTLLNRGSWQLRRHQNKIDPWKDQDPSTIKVNKVPQFGTGKDIDIIVCDQDMWFGHIEFQNPDGISNIQTYDNSTSAETVAPVNYLGGNALRDGFSATATSATNGTCDLLDLVLEAPYYLDPEFFEASPNTRLATRWDGTTVPIESVARAWWSTNSTSNRSAKFVSSSNPGGTASGVNDFGTISIPSGYTRANSNGTATAYQTGTGYHGTPCASQAYGRQYGWAYNANKWFLNLYGTNSIGFENGFDIQKVFHQIKPTNSEYGNKNPTISSNSWALRFSFNTGGGYYYYRQGATGSGGVQFTSWDFDGNTDGDTGVAPRFMTNFHQTSIRIEPQSGSMLTAGNELVAAGVIFVCSAGNSRQKLVDGSHPDFNNYVSDGNNTALSSSTASSSGVVYAKTINRPGMPGAIGKSGSGSSTVYNTIQVGALDDDHHITAELTSGGAGYSQSDGQYFASTTSGVPTKSGLIVKLVIASGIVTEIVIFEPGSGYAVGDVLTIDGQATTSATITITSVNEKEQRANYSNMGNAVDLYAAADSTLAACDDNSGSRHNRYDAYYSITTTFGGVASTIQSVESEDRIFNGTSSACPIAAGLIATKLENNRTWTKTEIKNWLATDVGEQNIDDFHFGTEVVGANDAGWAADYNNLHGGSPRVIWDTQAGSSALPYFLLNEQEYKPINAFNPEDNNPASGSFADTFVTGDKHRVFVNNARIVQNHDYSVGVGSVHLSHTTDNNNKNLVTSGKFVYGKRLGLEASGTEKWDDLTISADKGVFFRDGLETYYTIDKKVNNVKISKVESKPVKSDVVLKVAEQFPETSEVSTTLLGVSRAETQLSLFSNVSSYGLESKDWEVLEHRSIITLRQWAERINEIYGERTRGEIREETQESAIQLYLFPCPNTFPFGPKFEKNNLYNSSLFELYAKFIEMGNDLYTHYNNPSLTYASDSEKQKWLSRFLNPVIAAPTSGAKRDVEYFVELKQAFAAIDNWTETYRDIRASSLVSPISGDPSPIGFTEINIILGLAPLTYSTSNTRPGYNDNARRYLLLQSRRVFRYQPGRISGFTFGVRVAREQNTGFKLEWGIFNKTDHYVFQLDKGFLKIVRRSQVPLPEYIVESTGLLTTQEFVKTPDPQDSYESEENPTGADYKLHELVIPQDNFNGDSLDGNGPSGHSVKPENITMYKIEFGWYGAIGARFYAYIPAGNGEARWVVLHTLVIENQIRQPCLVDPYFRFRYVANITKSTDLRTPQFVYKYGASYYIDGGDEGTTSQNSIKTKPDAGRPGVALQGTTAILGIRPKDEIYNSLGIGIKNKKITIPTQLNMTTNALTKVRVGVCTGCPGWAHVHTQGFRRNGTDDSSLLGRQLPIKMTAPNTIEAFYPQSGTPVYFRKEDIGAKIIAPSIYNCYIVEVMDDSGNRGSLNQTPDAGYNNYPKATIHGFLGHERFVLGGVDGDTGRGFVGELAKDRSISPPVNVLLPNDVGFDDGVYRSEASKPDAQPVRLSNYDGLAISDYKLTGSEIDILFTVPRSSREGGIDPTWGYSHWGDVMVGITDVQPISDGTVNGVEFDIDWSNFELDEDGKPIEKIETGINTSVLPNNKILFAEHTHAWASSDIEGADSREAWPTWQFRTRLGLSHQVPPVVGISSGRCGRVKIRVGDPETIQNVTLVNKNPITNAEEGEFFLTSPAGGLTTIDKAAYDGGQVAYTVGTDPSIIKENNVTFVGDVGQTDPNPQGEVTEFIKISDTLSNVSVDGSLNLAIRKVNISTEFLKQNNNSTKIFKFDVFPLFPVIKLKDYGEINNVSIKEVVGETQVTVSPRFFVNGCDINTYGGLVSLPTSTTSTPPTNFRSVSDLSGAEFDNQNKCQIRDFVQKDIFYIGRDQTQSIDMSKVFSQDKEVIAADQNNVEATFVIADNIDPDSSISPTAQASLNFKEQ